MAICHAGPFKPIATTSARRGGRRWQVQRLRYRLGLEIRLLPGQPYIGVLQESRALPLTANYMNAIDAVTNPATGQIQCRSTATTAPNNGCVPLDVFGTGVNTQAAINYIEPGGGSLPASLVGSAGLVRRRERRAFLRLGRHRVAGHGRGTPDRAGHHRGGSVPWRLVWRELYPRQGPLQRHGRIRGNRGAAGPRRMVRQGA